MFTRSHWRKLSALLVGAMLALVAADAGAQAYPAKPIRLIVPYSTGSATDSLARLIADKLSVQPGTSRRRGESAERQRHSCVRPRSPRRRPTAILDHDRRHHVVNPSLYRNVPFDPVKDFKPIVSGRVRSLRPDRESVVAGQHRQGARCLRQGAPG